MWGCAGVHDAIGGDRVVVASPFQSWHKITSHEGTLYGSLDTKDEEKFGIWDVGHRKLLAKREGPTLFLHNSPQLLDSSLPYKDLKYAAVYNTKEDTELHTFKYGYYGAVANNYDELILGEQNSLLAMSWDSRGILSRDFLHRVESEMSRTANTIFPLLTDFNFKSPRNQKEIWDTFQKIIKQGKESDNERLIEQLKIDHHCVMNRCERAHSLRPYNFDEAMKRINKSWCGRNHDYHSSGGLADYMRDVGCTLFDTDRMRNRIQGISVLDEDSYLLGLHSGKLMRLDLFDSFFDQDRWTLVKTFSQQVLHTFGSEITAMVDIPEESFDGIRNRLSDKERAKYAAIAARNAQGRKFFRIAA